MHHRDARRERLARALELDESAINAQFAGVLRLDAGEKAAERALAGAILTAEGVARSSRDVEPDIVQRHHAGETLGDAVELDRGCRHAASWATRGTWGRRR